MFMAAQAEVAVLQLRIFPCTDLLSQVLARGPTLLPEFSLARTLRVHKVAERKVSSLSNEPLGFAQETYLVSWY